MAKTTAQTYEQGWNLRVADENAKPLRLCAKTTNSIGVVYLCNTAFMEAVCVSIRTGTQPVYPNLK